MSRAHFMCTYIPMYADHRRESDSSTTAHSLPAAAASVGDDRREGGSSQLAAAPSVRDDRRRERLHFSVKDRNQRTIDSSSLIRPHKLCSLIHLMAWRECYIHSTTVLCDTCNSCLMVFTVYGICTARGLYVLPRAEVHTARRRYNPMHCKKHETADLYR